MVDTLLFKPIHLFKPGIITSLLRQSYAPLLSAEPLIWGPEELNWQQFEDDVFDNPDTVGRCVFISIWQETPVGFGSFDPRQKPELGIIGHNCILPAYSGLGYGKQQILEILRIFRHKGIQKAVVTTSQHPFFTAAQKTYLACGFMETNRHAGGPDPQYGLIEYVKELT